MSLIRVVNQFIQGVFIQKNLTTIKHEKFDYGFLGAMLISQRVGSARGEERMDFIRSNEGCVFFEKESEI
jgi:hypothetical protein